MGMKPSLVGAIFTATQQRLFALLFGQPERSFFVTELIEHKTLGVNQQIREALEPVSADISYAVVYGSVAKKTDNSGSDVDLLVVSNHLLLEDLYRHLHTVEKKSGRKINPTMYTAAEFEQRMQKGSHFLTQVLAGPTLPVVGHLTRE
jgi:predicted nucleotidyltransferase